jgi:hypothetical protein
MPLVTAEFKTAVKQCIGIAVTCKFDLLAGHPGARSAGAIPATGKLMDFSRLPNFQTILIIVASYDRENRGFAEP